MQIIFSPAFSISVFICKTFWTIFVYIIIYLFTF